MCSEAKKSKSIIAEKANAEGYLPRADFENFEKNWGKSRKKPKIRNK